MPIPMPTIGIDQATGEPMAPMVAPPQTVEPNTWDWKPTIEGMGAPVPSQVPFTGGPGQAIVGQNKYTGMRVAPQWTPNDWAAFEQRKVAEDNARKAFLQQEEDKIQLRQMMEMNGRANNQLKAVDQAQKFIATRNFARDMESGVPLEQALTRNPGLWSGTSGGISAMGRIAQESEDAKMQSALPLGQVMPLIDPTTGKRVGVGVRSSRGAINVLKDDANPNAITTSHRLSALNRRATIATQEYRDLQQAAFLNKKLLPEVEAKKAELQAIKNELNRFSSIDQSSTEDKTESSVPEETPKKVRMISPDGKKFGMVPSSQVESALKQGYRHAN